MRYLILLLLLPSFCIGQEQRSFAPDTMGQKMFVSVNIGACAPVGSNTIYYDAFYPSNVGYQGTGFKSPGFEFNLSGIYLLSKTIGLTLNFNKEYSGKNANFEGLAGAYLSATGWNTRLNVGFLLSAGLSNPNLQNVTAGSGATLNPRMSFNPSPGFGIGGAFSGGILTIYKVSRTLYLNFSATYAISGVYFDGSTTQLENTIFEPSNKSTTYAGNLEATSMLLTMVDVSAGITIPLN